MLLNDSTLRVHLYNAITERYIQIKMNKNMLKIFHSELLFRDTLNGCCIFGGLSHHGKKKLYHKNKTNRNIDLIDPNEFASIGQIW